MGGESFVAPRDRSHVRTVSRVVPVVVRWMRLDEVPADPAPEVLSEAERSRLEGFRDDGDRRRFVGVRLLLRHVVADHTGCLRRDVALLQVCGRCGGPHGPPVIEVRGRPGPAVSMAHAGELAVVAVAAAPVGVDVEPLEHVAPLGDDLRTWVRREAVLKATGHGLDVDPRLLELSAADEPPRLTAWRGPGRGPTVRIADLAPEPGYVAAVARTGRRPLRLNTAAVPVTAL